MGNTQHEDFNRSAYDEYAFKKDVAYIRPVLVLCIFLYGIFGVMDYLYYPDYVRTFLTIRFVYVIPFFMLVLAFSYHKLFKICYQYLLLVIFIVSGFAIILMIYILGEHNFYYGGLYLVFSVAFFLLRLKPLFASIGTTVLITLFIVIGIFYDPIPLNEVLAQSVFYIGFAIIGIVGSNYHEQYRLNQFYQESIMQGEKIVLKKQIFEQYESIKNYHSATIFAIARLAESRDKFTGGHIYRVGKLSYLLAKKIPSEIYQRQKIEKADMLDSIQLASILHDIGKIAISDVILNKPGKLNKEEFDIIKTHTTIGYETLQSIQHDYKENTFISLGLQISKSHHERWDGSGYPEGLSNEKIPLAARIVSIIDVYDALISERPYKLPFSKEKSLLLIEEGIGTQFDPVLAKLFIAIANESDDKRLFGNPEGS